MRLRMPQKRERKPTHLTKLHAVSPVHPIMQKDALVVIICEEPHPYRIRHIALPCARRLTLQTSVGIRDFAELRLSHSRRLELAIPCQRRRSEARSPLSTGQLSYRLTLETSAHIAEILDGLRSNGGRCSEERFIGWSWCGRRYDGWRRWGRGCSRTRDPSAVDSGTRWYSLGCQ